MNVLWSDPIEESAVGGVAHVDIRVIDEFGCGITYLDYGKVTMKVLKLK